MPATTSVGFAYQELRGVRRSSAPARVPASYIGLAWAAGSWSARVAGEFSFSAISPRTAVAHGLKAISMSHNASSTPCHVPRVNPTPWPLRADSCLVQSQPINDAPPLLTSSCGLCHHSASRRTSLRESLPFKRAEPPLSHFPSQHTTI